MFSIFKLGNTKVCLSVGGNDPTEMEWLVINTGERRLRGSKAWSR